MSEFNMSVQALAGEIVAADGGIARFITSETQL